MINLRFKINFFFLDDWIVMERGLMLWGRIFVLKMWLVINNLEIVLLIKFECVKVDLLLLEKLIGGIEWKGIW